VHANAIPHESSPSLDLQHGGMGQRQRLLAQVPGLAELLGLVRFEAEPPTVPGGTSRLRATALEDSATTGTSVVSKQEKYQREQLYLRMVDVFIAPPAIIGPKRIGRPPGRRVQGVTPVASSSKQAGRRSLIPPRSEPESKTAAVGSPPVVRPSSAAWGKGRLYLTDRSRRSLSFSPSSSRGAGGRSTIGKIQLFQFTFHLNHEICASNNKA
jgi:hypothetical protein